MPNPLLKGLEEFGIKYVGNQRVPKSVSEGLGFLGSLAGGGPLAAFLLGMAPKTVAPATYEEGESKMADEVYRYPEVNLTVPSAGEHNPKYSYDQSSLPLATLTGDPKGRDWSETFRLTKNRWSVDHLLEMLRQGSITEEQLERDLGREDTQGPYLGGRGDAPERRAVIKSALAVFRREKARAASSLNESRFQGTSPDQNLRTWDEAFQADQDIAQKTYESPPLMEGSFQAMDEDRYDPHAFLEMYDRAPYGEATPDMLPREGGQPFQTAPGYDLGGLVTPSGPGTFPQTASENMMAMGSAPPPDEFGERTPVPSSDAQALIQALEEVRRSGTVGQIRGFLSSNMANLLTVASQDPDFANRLESIMESMPRGGGGDQSGFQDMMEYNLRGAPSGTAGMLPEAANLLLGDTRLSDQDIRGYRELMGQLPSDSLEPYDPLAGSPFVPPEDLPAMMPDWGGNKFAHGGYVGRGTMAGELGRRGDLSVREAGETMYERSKRLHGYDRGGYVHGRGTMPGELHPKGSLSVRVAGESMGEYKKHREDEDEHRPVRRTLDNVLSPTLSRRMFS
jgi:hypothetical protein